MKKQVQIQYVIEKYNYRNRAYEETMERFKAFSPHVCV